MSGKAFQPAGELNAQEAATLAGLVKNPVEYDPVKNPEDSVARRNLVLVGMAVDGADAATAYAAVQAGQVPKQVGLGLVGVASFAVVSGLLGLRVKKSTKKLAAA